MMSNEELLALADQYANSKGIEVVRQPMLGYGSDGSVWRTSRGTALKILVKRHSFQNELECYQRFQAANLTDLAGFAVPFLEGFDESLMAIEMSIVDPPYLLDFGKVHLDVPPPYYGDKQLMANAYEEWRERFGKDWKRVAYVMSALRTQFGIYYVDPRPSNICTGHETDEDWMKDRPVDDAGDVDDEDAEQF